MKTYSVLPVLATSLFFSACTIAVGIAFGGWEALSVGIVGSIITLAAHCHQLDIDGQPEDTLG